MRSDQRLRRVKSHQSTTPTRSSQTDFCTFLNSESRSKLFLCFIFIPLLACLIYPSVNLVLYLASLSHYHIKVFTFPLSRLRLQNSSRLTPTIVHFSCSRFHIQNLFSYSDHTNATGLYSHPIPPPNPLFTSPHLSAPIIYTFRNHSSPRPYHQIQQAEPFSFLPILLNSYRSTGFVKQSSRTAAWSLLIEKYALPFFIAYFLKMCCKLISRRMSFKIRASIFSSGSQYVTRCGAQCGEWTQQFCSLVIILQKFFRVEVPIYSFEFINCLWYSSRDIVNVEYFRSV